MVYQHFSSALFSTPPDIVAFAFLVSFFQDPSHGTCARVDEKLLLVSTDEKEWHLIRNDSVRV